jgi:hypothetical protein
MPAGAKILSVQDQTGVICLWARVWTEAKEKELRTFIIVGTGREFPPSSRPPEYIASVQQDGFVWHIFEQVGKEVA